MTLHLFALTSTLLTTQAAPVTTASAVAAPVVEDAARSRFVLSARGPGQGHAAFAFGLSFLDILPIGELRMLWSPLARVDLDVHTRLSLALQHGTVGARVRVIGSDRFSLALRGGAEGYAIHDPETLTSLGALFFKPGVLLSTGGREWQLTLEAHAPLVLAGREQRNGTERRLAGGINAVEVSLGLDLGSSVPANAYLQATVIASLDGGGVAPIFSAGAAF